MGRLQRFSKTGIPMLIIASLLAYWAYRYYKTRFSCLLSNEWTEHTIDLPSLLINDEITRPTAFPYQSIKQQKPDQNSHIPSILHQTWKNKDIPERWKEPFESCQELLGSMLLL
jgi:mannosyltransferase OCH1-like enzyme